MVAVVVVVVVDVAAAFAVFRVLPSRRGARTRNMRRACYQAASYFFGPMFGFSPGIYSRSTAAWHAKNTA